MKYFLLLLFPIVVSAQNLKPVKFGLISKEEMEMKVYEPDSGAVAVILFDVGENTLTGVKSVYKRHTRIKILKKGGYRYADVFIPFFDNNSREEIRNLRASTFNMVNGRMEETKLESNGKFNDEIIDGLTVTKFAMPKVQVGSVLEYEYEVTRKSPFALVSWEFQSLIPCMWSEFELHVSSMIGFKLNFQGYLSPSVNETSEDICGGLTASEAQTFGIPANRLKEINDQIRQCKVHHWVMNDVPALDQEPFIDSYKNYLSQVRFDISTYTPPNGVTLTILSSWDDFRTRYYDRVFAGDNIKNSGFLKNKAIELANSKSLPDEKLIAIYQFVKDSYLFKGWHSAFPSREFKKTFEDKTGSSGDINLTLLAMLRYAGLQANPVLISTRDHGVVRQAVPLGDQFNSVVVISDYKGKKVLLDATDKYLSMDYLPQKCLNGWGIQVGDQNYSWLSLSEIPKSRTVANVDVTLAESGALAGKLSFVRSGYDAKVAREAMWKQGEDDYQKNIFSGKSVNWTSKNIEGKEKINDVLKEAYTIEIENPFQVTDNTIYIDPLLLYKQVANPFRAETRKYPIDFDYPRDIVYTMKLKLPQGFSADEIPKPKLSMLPNNDGRFMYSISQVEGNILMITSQLSINKITFPQNDYPVVREFYNIVVAKHGESIVLRKK